jgi:hypothetical protein
MNKPPLATTLRKPGALVPQGPTLKTLAEAEIADVTANLTQDVMRALFPVANAPAPASLVARIVQHLHNLGAVGPARLRVAAAPDTGEMYVFIDSNAGQVRMKVERPDAGEAPPPTHAMPALSMRPGVPPVGHTAPNIPASEDLKPETQR